MLSVRVFRAVDEPAACARFAEGHANVLRDYGVPRVTSAKNDWQHNPGVYVAVVEDEMGGMQGGLRINQVFGAIPLPLETAIGQVDVGVYDLVGRYSENGNLTGELCGLWNAKAIAGHGVGFFLIKLGIAFAVRLEMNSLLALCSPFTVEMCKSVGFHTDTSIGNSGMFNYPKLDLVATIMVIPVLSDRSGILPEHLEQIEQMICNSTGLINEIGAKGHAVIGYNTKLPLVKNL